MFTSQGATGAIFHGLLLIHDYKGKGGIYLNPFSPGVHICLALEIREYIYVSMFLSVILTH